MSWLQGLKGCKPAALMLGLRFLVMPAFTATASERYPTEQELRQLRADLSQRVRSLLSSEMSHLLSDPRTSQERQRRQAFVSAWTRANPAIAPFLGLWIGYEQTLSIYPSRNRNQVCLIEGNEEGSASFATGTVLPNGDIQASDRRFIIRSGNYLGIASVDYGQPNVGGETPLHSPYPLDDPSRLNLSRNQRQQFTQARCTASRP